jgi:hypothetical protein
MSRIICSIFGSDAESEGYVRKANCRDCSCSGDCRDIGRPGDDERVWPNGAYSRKNIPDSPSNIVGISPVGIMRRLVVVATTRAASVNRFPQNSLTEARNMKDFLEQTGDYSTVKIYELEKTLGPLQQWAELEESTR